MWGETFRGFFSTQEMMGKMAVGSRTFSKKDAAIPLGLRVSNTRVSTGFRRVFVWTEIVVVFLLLEFALWAPSTRLRNRWAAITGIAILVFVVIDAAAGRTSLKHLGLRWPKMADAGIVLGIGGCDRGFFAAFCELGGRRDSGQSELVPEFTVDLGLCALVDYAGIYPVIFFL
jgi:hypothetical protein